MSKITLEACAFSYDACIKAAMGGADRIELCLDPIQGGTTPNYGLIKKVREDIEINLYPIIRPRGGNFIYSEEEFEIMKNDIIICKQLGCNGVATGIQTTKGNIDKDRMKKLVDAAWPMGVTCIRAFDLVPDVFEALDDLIEIGCERILTSGQAAFAIEAAELINKLHETAADRIKIMAGSGVRSDNIEDLVKTTKIREYHTSARKQVPNTLSGNSNVMKGFGQHFSCDVEELKLIRKKAELLL